MKRIKGIFERVMKMFGFYTTLDALGIKPAVSSIMTEKITEWRELYKSDDGLSLAHAIAAEIARLTTVEFRTEITGSERAEFLNKSYQRFIKDICRHTESAAALGGVMFKPYVSDGEIYIDCIQAENFIPTAVDAAGNITGCVFSDRVFCGKKYYTRIEEHIKEQETGHYIIKNHAYVSDNAGNIGRKIPLKDTGIWTDMQEEAVLINIKRPLFAYFKMPQANRNDEESPLGASVFSGAGKLIADADKQYERLLWEFESGERALYTDETAFRKDKDGTARLPDKRLYRLLSTEGGELFEDWTPTLRQEQIIDGLNEILRRIEFGTGLAYGTLSDAQLSDKTAEEVKSSKQRSYCTVANIQTALKGALTELLECCDILTDLYSLCPDGGYFISFDFDDSIIADRKTEFEEKIRLVSLGILKPWELRAWYLGEDEAVAKMGVALPDEEPEE